jgi:hypothetical protein
LGARPISISKYGLEIAALHPEVPSNPWHAILHRYFEQPVVEGAGDLCA